MNPWMQQHQIAFLDAWRRLVGAPLNTFLSLLVIGIALTLPAAAYVLLDNVRDMARGISGGQQISVFMAMDASRKDLAEIESRLQAGGTWQWQFVSREDALRRLQEAPSMGEALAGLGRNPLPDAYVIDVADAGPEQQETLVKTLSTWPRVAHVQQDANWAKRLEAFFRLGRTAVLLLGVVFAVGLVAVTFNTIRLQVLGQADEVELARLIGATDDFICRPFLYFGALQGALGGVLAALMTSLGMHLLGGPADQLLALYGEGLSLGGPGLHHGLLLAIVGGSLGWLGARLSLALFLADSH